jgi:hypothetical protein
MSNGLAPEGLNTRSGLDPFGDPGPAEAGSGRLTGILAGSEQLLAQAAVHLVEVGGGLLVAGTRDGGAISLTAFYGRNKATRYAASPEELQALLERLVGWEPAKPVPFPPRTLSVGDRAR